MAIVLKDRVKETAPAPGTGTITLGGAAAGFQAFSAIGNANVTYFAIVDSGSGAWEVNYGTYTASGTTLTRNATPLSSSSAGALVNFTGAVEVFCTYPSGKAIYEEADGSVIFDGGPITVIGTGVTTYTSFTNFFAEMFGNANTYVQTYIQNQNSGSDASADYVALNDIGTDSTYYVDMGMNSSGYTSGTFQIYTPNSGYVYSIGGVTPSKMFVGSGDDDLILHAGGFAPTNIGLTISGVDQTVDIAKDATVGGTFDATGAATFGSTVTLNANPSLALQAATKQYVDNQVTAGLHIHEPVLIETTGNLTASYTQGGTTFDITTITGNKTLTTSVNHGLALNDQIWLYSTAGNGLLTNTAYFVYSTPALNQITVSLTFDGAELTGLTNAAGLTYNTRANSGVGSKLTNSGAQAALVIDNVTLASTNRVMVRLQTNPAENGVYTVTNIGSGSTNWELTRATDSDKVNPADPNGVGTGDYYFTQDGDLNAGDSHVLTTEPNTMILGYTGLTYTQFSGGVAYTGAAPIDVTGQTISLTGTVAATNGGTGTNTVTTGDLLYGSATNTWSKLPVGAAYRSLSVNAGGTNVEWNAVALNQAAAVSGSLGETNGGTGQSGYTLGDTLYSSAANTLARLPGNITTTKKFLAQTGTGAASASPLWDTISGADVTGNISGQAGSVANALTAGTYLTSAGTYDGSAARTFAVDATSTNTASKVVARDASGNFSAGTITATLSGAATSATTATNLAGGAANRIAYQSGAGATTFTVAPSASNQVLNWNGSAFTWSAGTISGVALGSNLNTLTFGTYLTGTSYNGSGAVTLATNATNLNTASTLVARDASGNFSAGTITAALSGNATTSSSTSGNAATATALQTARTINGVSFNGTANITVADATKLPLAGGTLTGNLLFANATSPFSNYIQFGDNSGWNFRFMTSVAGTPTTRFTFGDNGNFTAVGSVTGTNITAAGNVTGTASGNLALAGGTMTGLIIGKVSNVADINNANDAGSMSVRGDVSFPAVMSFHRAAAFAINMGLSTSNNFVIGGWSATANAFSMSSVGALTMANNITAYSDERVKTNWRDLRPDFIERLAEVKHGIYDRTDQVSTQVGVSAQSLQKILEHAVMESDEGHLSVAYGNAALVAAVKLAERVVALEARLAALEAKG